MNFRSVLPALLIFIFAGFATAQQQASKIAVINSTAFFNEKSGITKIVNANKQLLTEFTPIQAELDTLNKRLQTIANEIENLRKQPNPDARAIQAKADEGEQLQRTAKYKAEDAKEKYARREQEVLGPIQLAVSNGLQEYAKTKAYALIFDVAKDQNGLLVAFGDQSLDVTKDFITYYNTKP